MQKETPHVDTSNLRRHGNSSSSNDETQNYETSQHTIIGFNDQIPILPQHSEVAVNTQLGAKHIFLQIIPMKLSNGHTFIESNALFDCVCFVCFV